MMNTARRVLWCLAAAAFSCAAWGCGEAHYEHALVRGKVTYKGKPVPLGSVLFVPVQSPPDGSVHPASGTINPDGSYELQSKADPGAIIGEHKVIVMAIDAGQSAGARDLSKTAKVGPAPATKAVRLKSLVPEKYSNLESTPLTRKVVPGENSIDIELAD